jgi:hypothetical protein
MITVSRLFYRNRVVVFTGIVVLIAVTAAATLPPPGSTLAQAAKSDHIQSGDLPAGPPSPPIPLTPPVQGPTLNRKPMQSVDRSQLRDSDINGVEFDPQVRVHLGDLPQPPAEARPLSADKMGVQREGAARELIGARQTSQPFEQANLLQAQGWTNQVYENFDGAFPTGCWMLEDYGPDGLDIQWGIDDKYVWYGSGAAWPARGGSDGWDPEVTPHYSDNLDSWMICGPFDFSNAADVFVDFGLWLDTEIYYDWLYFGASVDNLTYDVSYWSGYSDGWTDQPLWLSAYAGYSQVWLAWIFTSDDSFSEGYEGAWVDEISVWTYEIPAMDDAGNLVQDGSFEEGGVGWIPITRSVQSAVSVADLSLPDLTQESSLVLAPTDSYVTNRTAVHGEWSAFMYADGELDDFLVQPVVIPTGTTDIQFDFWFGVTTNETTQRTDWFCASLANADIDTLIVDLGCLDATNTTGYWQEVLYTFTDAEVQQALDGGAVWLIFELYNRGDQGTGTAAWLDYIRLYATGGEAGMYIDSNEPNDVPGEATAISCGGEASGTIGDALVSYGDVDWFRLENVATGRLDVDLDAESLSPPSALDSVVYLFDDSGATTPLAWNDDDGASYDSYVVYTNTTPNATFYIAVVSYSGYGGPDSFYNLKISCADAGTGPPSAPDTPTGDADTWTVMLYLNAEDSSFAPILQGYISDMETVLNGKTGFMTVTVLYDGPQSGDTMRYVLQPDGNYTDGVNRWPISEQNMGDPDTLATFAKWSMDNYPAENYYLAIDDHGHGVYGISWDKTNNNDSITPPELYSALKNATNNGARKIDIFDYEACLMGMAENAYDVREWVDYVVFFEQISWGLNTYPTYFSDLGSTDAPLTVGTRIINRYHAEADNEGYPHTISLVDTSQMANVKQAATNLGNALVATGDRTAVTNARNNSQAFAADNDATNPAYADYTDLWDLADETAGLSGVATSATQVKNAVQNAVEVEQHSSGNVDGFYWDHSNVHGLSIYYPASNASGVFGDYIAERLFKMSADESSINGRWDEFLEWAVTSSGNGAGNGLGGGDRKGMHSFRFLQPKLGAVSRVYLPLVMRSYPPLPDVPTLYTIDNADKNGDYTVSWSASSGATGYTLQEANNASFTGAMPVYSGSGTSTSITGKAAGTYYYRVNASNGYGSSGWSNVQSVTVVPPSNPIQNGDFENGRDGSWTEYSAQGWDLISTDITVPAHSGSWAAWLGGDNDEIAYIEQQVTIPSGSSVLSFWYWINSEDSCGNDFGGVIINGSTVVDAFDLCSSTNTGGWVRRTVDLNAYAGQTVQLQIRAETNSSLNSNLFVDDVAF